MARDASLVGVLVVAATALGCAGGLRPGSPGVPSASDTSGCVVTMLVGTAVGDGNTIQAVVAGSVSNVNDQSVAHFDAESDEVIIDGAFGTAKLGFVHDDRATVVYQTRDGIESTPFGKESRITFAVAGIGDYEATGERCTNRELGLGAVHLMSLVFHQVSRRR